MGQYTKIHTVSGEEEWISNLPKNGGYNFAIVLNDGDKLLGNISLVNINKTNRTAELGIFIGNEDYLSKGYGSEAIMLILDYGFNYLNLFNIMLKALSFNKRALKAYEKCGFKTFGVWKESEYFNGEYFDNVYMNILIPKGTNYLFTGYFSNIAGNDLQDSNSKHNAGDGELILDIGTVFKIDKKQITIDKYGKEKTIYDVHVVSVSD